MCRDSFLMEIKQYIKPLSMLSWSCRVYKYGMCMNRSHAKLHGKGKPSPIMTHTSTQYWAMESDLSLVSKQQAAGDLSQKPCAVTGTFHQKHGFHS